MSHTVFVHAHPDDETLWTGGTMAAMAEAGETVSLITATRGERGEVIPLTLHDLQDDPDALGAYREKELAAACRALGVTSHCFLGERQGRVFKDSGMRWERPGKAGPALDVGDDALTSAPIEEISDLLSKEFFRLGATKVVTYDPTGGYYHPDHIAVHEAVMHAVAHGTHAVADVWWSVVDAAEVMQGIDQMADLGLPTLGLDDALPGCAVDFGDIEHSIDVQHVLDRKIAAMEAHATQIVVDYPGYSLSNAQYLPIAGIEHYRAGWPQ